MAVHETIFHELIKHGYSQRGHARVWDISDSKLLYLTPELIEGYLALENFDPYKKHIHEPELHLLHAHAGEIVNHVKTPTFNLVDLGSGTGMKAAALLSHLPKQARVRYCPVDYSELLLAQAVKRVRALKTTGVKTIKPFRADFTEFESVAAQLRSGEFARNVHLLLGSTLSTFELNALLYGLSGAMFSDDVLVIGNGVRKGRRFVGLQKYNSPLFDQWFIHIMKGLGFERHEVKYGARFANGRLEGFYKILTDKKVSHKGKSVAFRKGDEVIVGIQYKYYPAELKKFCEMYFRTVTLHKDPSDEYALLICVK